MKISQLRRWLVDSGCADEWYVCVNGDVDPTLYQLEAIERIAEEFRGVDVQVMHGSRSSIDGVSEWMRLEQKPVVKTSLTSSGSDLLSKRSAVAPKLMAFGCLILITLIGIIVYQQGVMRGKDQQLANSAQGGTTKIVMSEKSRLNLDESASREFALR